MTQTRSRQQGWRVFADLCRWPIPLCFALASVFAAWAHVPMYTAPLGVPSPGYHVLYSFPQLSEMGTNMEGARTKGGLLRSGSTLYGVATDGGTAGNGTVYKVNVDGSGLTVLHTFSAYNPPLNSNADGGKPQAGLILFGNTLYGTALGGGAVGYGTVFKVNTDGTGFTTLHSFGGSNVDGNSPQGPLLLAGNTLYGGNSNKLFAVNTDGSGFRLVHEFIDPAFGSDASHTGLVQIGATLYGTTAAGGGSYGIPQGSAGSGTVFAVETDGTGFHVIHNFSPIDPNTSANADGTNPLGRLAVYGGRLFGTANFGGAFTRGTVFSLDTAGTDFRILHTFSNFTNFQNVDGANPVAGLAIAGSTLYGTTTIGGRFAGGNIFSMNADGTGFSVLHNFQNGLGGGSDSPLIVSGRTLFGTSPAFPSGNVFSVTFSKTPFDYDGDGLTDISVFRPSSGAWYLQRSTAGLVGAEFGFDSDKLAPADYNGDGKTDIAVYRPTTGIWYVFDVESGTTSYYVFGSAEDLPTPADYDGDGKADVSVFRPSTGTWYRQNSSDGSFYAQQFGATGDKPVLGDYDGDGKADLSVFRPSTGAWYQIYSSDGSLHGEAFGFDTDVTVQADYDGDGKTDIAVYRPSNGFWYIRNSNGPVYTAFPFGLADDIPAPGDFDGDGRSDLSVFRPTDGIWYRMNSSNGSFEAYPFGTAGDRPTMTAFRY
jgi:uncharacterized repeat protein (TIGR03803 family)